MKVLAVLISLAALAAKGSDMVSATAASTEVLKVHYHRFKNDYDRWTLWVWNMKSQGPGKSVEQAGKDDFGVYFEITPSDNLIPERVGILPRLGDWEARDDPDRVWIRGMPGEVYILSGREGLSTDKPEIRPIIRGAWLDAPGFVTVAASIPMTGEVLSNSMNSTGPVSLATPGGTVIRPDKILMPKPGIPGTEGVIFCDFGDLDLSHLAEAGLTVKVEGFAPVVLKQRHILDSMKPDLSLPLGMTFREDEFIFRVFSPLSKKVEILLYPDPARNTEPIAIPMNRREGGLWEGTTGLAAEGKHYTFRTCGASGFTGTTGQGVTREIREGIDPYATCISPGGAAALVWRDTGTLDPGPGTPPEPFDASRAVIYELHVRDFTIDPASGVKARGKYMGLTEAGTRLSGHPQITTGLDHLVDLGVDVVQIMPVHDFANDEESDAYNWGYMPVNFNSPDGWYASTTTGTARVIELAAMIRALHSKGIKVVLDVVYNHTAESIGNPVNFEVMAPGYYYRFWPDGTPANGSGCGNEFRSESPMGRRFIVDTLCQWVRRYDVDGFRFDLMGLIDLPTMTEAARALRTIKPDILIYGEPWAAGPTPATITGQGAQRGLGIAVFNDKFRDAVRGSVWDTSTGFAGSGGKANPGQIDLLRKVVTGSMDLFTQVPQESINYSEVHDNRTLRDRFAYTRPEATEKEIEAMIRISAGILLTSQGIPLIHSGMEMLRTKGGEHNSYDKPDPVNMIRWKWKLEHRDLVEFFRDLIALRKSHPMFTMTDPAEVAESISFPSDDGLRVPRGCFAWRISKSSSGDSWKESLILINPGPSRALFDTGRDNMTFVVKNSRFADGWNSPEYVKTAGPAGKAEISSEKPGNPAAKVGKKIFVGPLSISILRR